MRSLTVNFQLNGLAVWLYRLVKASRVPDSSSRPRPAAGTGRDVPGQVWLPGPGFCRGDHAVGADDDGQRRVGHQGPYGRRWCVAGEMGVDPAGVLPGARFWGGAGAGCAADPRQDEGVPAAEIRQSGVGAARGQHGGASGQDRVQPDGGSVACAHQRVGDQAAGPQRGGDAGRQKAPRGVLQGAGLQPRRRGGAHELADAVAADGGGDPAG